MNSEKTVIVTGASSGIGFAIAKAYLERGYNVVGNARTLARLGRAAAKLGKPSNFLPVDTPLHPDDAGARDFLLFAEQSCHT